MLAVPPPAVGRRADVVPAAGALEDVHGPPLEGAAEAEEEAAEDAAGYGVPQTPDRGGGVPKPEGKQP